jgi:hypothetical protein
VTTFCENIKVINSGIVLKKALESILDGGIKVIGHSAVRNGTRAMTDDKFFGKIRQKRISRIDTSG